MGLTVESIRFLLEGWPQERPVRRVLTLGRQDLWVGPERLRRLLAEHGRWPPDGDAGAFREAMLKAGWRLAAFFRWLGVEETRALDASDYEGADLVWDLNQPIPDDWDGQFDLVIDGGTLEHVFHFPTALANAMRLTGVGGRLVLFTPATNYCGHGFYQFSPELFYRALSPENGFRVRRLEAAVDTAGFARLLGVRYSFPIRSRRHWVADPAEVGERVVLVDRRPVLLFVEAVKERAVRPFATAPQQSDYVPQWTRKQAAQPLAQTGPAARLAAWLQEKLGEDFCREALPRLAGCLDPLRGWRFFRRLSRANRRHYQPVVRGDHPKRP
ncbi:MAG: hypothetical protein D6766_12730 [Verrucomicrobia bacterium]|nr:MAG: hypothetical protein D6766_12730 [Verrucomicrobiota bacterium]